PCNLRGFPQSHRHRLAGAASGEDGADDRLNVAKQESPPPPIEAILRRSETTITGIVAFLGFEPVYKVDSPDSPTGPFFRRNPSQICPLCLAQALSRPRLNCQPRSRPNATIPD